MSISTEISPGNLLESDEKFKQCSMPRKPAIPRRKPISTKKRASVACLICRLRKVRCNLTENGTPCTNCRLDDEACVITGGKRRKTCAIPTQPILSRKSRVSPESSIKPTQLGKEEDGPCDSICSKLCLPHYISPISAHLQGKDVAYLAAKGAFTIPPTFLRDQLLKSYVEVVHSHVPIVDITKVVNIIDGRNAGADSRISLLLFQTMMFSGAASVSKAYLLSAGYQSRYEACHELFNRARLLYEFDYETGQYEDSVLQSLILIAHWYHTYNEFKDSRHWLGAAIALSYRLCMHRDMGKSSAISISKQRLYKRMWWSVHVLDKIVGLGLSQPARIKADDFEVPMLTLADFDDTELPKGQSCLPESCNVLRDAGQQRQLAMIFIEKAKLSVCMGWVISAQFSLRQSSEYDWSVAAVPESSPDLENATWEPGALQEYYNALQKWKRDLPRDIRHMHIPGADPGLYESIAFSQCFMYMMYCATMSALDPKRDTENFHVGSHQAICTTPNAHITTIASCLGNFKLLRAQPTACMVFLMPGVATYITNANMLDGTSQKEILACLDLYGQILEQPHDTRPGAVIERSSFVPTINQGANIISGACPPSTADSIQNKIPLENTFAQDNLFPSAVKQFCSLYEEDMAGKKLPQEPLEQSTTMAQAVADDELLKIFTSLPFIDAADSS